MRICLLCEGSYPYIAGGVASWIHTFIREFSDCEFIIYAIATNKKEMGTYRYELPSNVTRVITNYLSEPGPERKGTIKFTKNEEKLLRQLLLGKPEEICWPLQAEMLEKYRDHIEEMVNSESFYKIALEQYEKTKQASVFSRYVWNFRGMNLPFFKIVCSEIPDADLYHSVSAGYAGLAATMFASVKGRPFVLSEHGIYTREREEDIIRATWLDGDYKEMWIRFFKRLSTMAYLRANAVTTLFNENGNLQADLGCPPEKIRHIPNGIDPEDVRLNFSRSEESKKYFNFGAVLRIVPIKDLKTMIVAFSQVRQKLPNVRLHIYGNFDEAPEYHTECVNLIRKMNIPDIIFYGQVNIRDYLHDIDTILLTSISEGQPLSILEGFALGIPSIATNVGSCKELICGAGEDHLGPAGFIVPVMDISALVAAMTYAAEHKDEMVEMGKTGRKRVLTYYQKQSYLDAYRKMYEEMMELDIKVPEQEIKNTKKGWFGNGRHRIRIKKDL